MSGKVVGTEIPYESKSYIYFCKGVDGKVEVWRAVRGRKKKTTPDPKPIEKPPIEEPQVTTEPPQARHIPDPEKPVEEQPKVTNPEEDIPF